MRARTRGHFSRSFLSPLQTGSDSIKAGDGNNYILGGAGELDTVESGAGRDVCAHARAHTLRMQQAIDSLRTFRCSLIEIF